MQPQSVHSRRSGRRRRRSFFESLEPRLVLTAPVGLPENYQIVEDNLLAVGQLPSSQLLMSSAPGDYIGQGRDYHYQAPPDADITAVGDANGVAIRVDTPDFPMHWSLRFFPASGQALAVGTYENAQRSSSADHPGLDISGEFRGCGDNVGQFIVESIGFDSAGLVSEFVATFEHHCFLGAAPLTGRIDYNHDTTGIAQGVLINDSDEDGDPLRALLVTAPSHGSWTLAHNGAFLYQPDPDFSGQDTFSYRASDGTSESDPITVSIDVEPVNDAPRVANETLVIPPDTPWEGRVTAVDPDSSELTYVLDSSVSQGTLNFLTDGTFSYIPPENFLGTESFAYHVSDGTSSSASVTVTIHVDVIPVAADDEFSIDEDMVLQVGPERFSTAHFQSEDPDEPLGGGQTYDYGPPMIDNFLFVFGGRDFINMFASGPDGYWTIGLTPPDGGALVEGTYTNAGRSLGGDRPGLSVTRSGSPCASSEFTGEFTISELTLPGGVDSIAMSFVQQCGGHTLRGSFTYRGLVPGRFGVLANDSDTATDILEATLVTPPGHGQVVVEPNGAFRYTPNSHFFGDDSFTYQVSDGIAISSPATATIHVNPVNDPPVLFSSSYLVAPGTFDAQPLAADVDDDPLTYRITSPPQFGTVEFDSEGVFHYSSNPGFLGVDSFSAVANDGTVDSGEAIFTIDVNTPPVANPDSYTIEEDQPLFVNYPGILENDVDPDGDFLFSFAVRSNPQFGSFSYNSGGFIYFPNSEFSGTDSFTYFLSDGRYTVQGEVTITILEVHDVPQVENLLYLGPIDEPIFGQFVASDPDTPDLQFEIVSLPAHGSLDLEPGGAFIYTPEPGFTGSDPFNYRAFDGTSYSEIATVSIEIDKIPEAFDDAYTLDEDSSIQVGPPRLTQASITQTDGSGTATFDYQTDTANFNAFGSNQFATVFVSGYDANSWRVEMSAPAGQSLRETTYTGAGQYYDATRPALTVQRNGEACFDDTGEFTIHVLERQGSELFAILADFSVHCSGRDISGTVSYKASPPGRFGVMENDIDTPEDRLTAQLVTGPQHGQLDLAPNGSFFYKPIGNFHGEDSFTYRVIDSPFTSNLATVTLQVNSVNDLPFPLSAFYIVRPDTPRAQQLVAFDEDEEPLTFRSAAGPEHGTLDLQPDGAFVYTPNAGYTGPDGFDFIPNDGIEDGPSGRITFDVNRQPVEVEDSYTVAEDGVLTVGIPPFYHVHLESEPGDFVGQGLTRDFTAADGRFSSLTAGSRTAHMFFNSNTESWSFRFSDAEFLKPGTYASALRNGSPSIEINANGRGCNTVSGQFTIDQILHAFDGSVLTFVGSFEQSCDGGPLLRGTIEYGVLPAGHQGVLENDLDSPDDRLLVAYWGGQSHGTLDVTPTGSFVYKPAPNYFGPDEFFYTATDGTEFAESVRVSINVVPVNDPPIADPFRLDIPLKTTGSGQLTATDAEGDPVTFSLRKQPKFGKLTLGPDGSFTYQPRGMFTGSDSFTVIPSDGHENGEPLVVSIQVHAPPKARDDNYAIDEDGTLELGDLDRLNYLRMESDPGHPIGLGATYNITKNIGGFPFVGSTVYGAYIYAGDFIDGFWQMQFSVPGELRPGTYTDLRSFTDGVHPGLYLSTFPRFCDTNGGQFTVRQLQYTNFSFDAFAVDFEHRCAGAEGALRGSLRFNALQTDPQGVLENDTDADGDALTTLLVSPPSHGTLDLRPNGALRYVPDRNFNGNDEFTYRAVDAYGESKVAKVRIRVRPVNDAPEIGTQVFATTDSAINGSLIGTVQAVDAEGDKLTYTLLGPDKAFSIDPRTGELMVNDEMQLDSEQRPFVVYSLQVKDSKGASSYADIIIQVDPGLRGSFQVADDVLRIFGTSESDDIRVSKGSGNRLIVTAGFGTQTVQSIKEVRVHGFSGDDSIALAADSSARGLISSGSGNDTVRGGAGEDIIWGEAGNDELFGLGRNDILEGGAGDDLLEGGAGRDLLVGGWDADILRGDQDEDLLIAGRTQFDPNQSALRAILKEWSSGRSYADRVSNLSGRRVNERYYLRAGETVFDDFASDSLSGGAGRDWFFYDPSNDVIEDLLETETTGNP